MGDALPLKKVSFFKAMVVLFSLHFNFVKMFKTNRNLAKIHFGITFYIVECKFSDFLRKIKKYGKIIFL